MSQEKKLVPKLRFPEFRGADAWEPTTIGELGRFYYGKSAPKWSLAADAPTPCVRYGELYTKFGPVITETYSRTKTSPEALRFSKGGEILIPRVGEKPDDFGKCCSYLPLKDIAIGEMISVLETKQHPLFYTYYFRNLYKQFAKVVEGQNVKNLYFAELEPLPIHRPSIPEQQKIAECLSSVDELMAAQVRKVDALKTHKKGLMQQLFPREGETQPRLRFPEFQNAGEWEAKALAELVEVASGQVDPTAPQYCSLVQIGSENIESNTGELINLKSAIDKGVMSGNYAFDENDVLYSKIRPALNKVAAPAFKGICSADIYPIRPANSRLLRSYLVYLLLGPKFLGYAIQNSERGKIPKINRDDLLTYEALIPSPAEQQRIADCLTSLDTLITAATQEIEALKTHKKGLMQQLFPSAETVAVAA